MFDGGDQFHQLIASSRTSLPIPTLPFPFDSYAPPLHHQLPPPPAAAAKNSHSTNLALESDRSRDPWSNDELLALLKVRSSMEIWFPDFTWEHVSRKLGELGFKRSGEECKEKFEEESSAHFNSNKNYRILSELDEFYHAHEHEHRHGHEPEQTRKKGDEVDQERVEEDSRNTAAAAEEVAKKAMNSKKRKRREKLEMFKGFCEAVVNTMMAKQEELHQKLIHDIMKRDEEKIAREEAWKSQELDRVKTQFEIRSKEQKSAADRQATIIEFLKQFTSDQDQNLNNNSNSNSSASFCQNHHPQNPTPPFPNPPTKTRTKTKTPSPPSPSSRPKPSDNDMLGYDVGKRWPREEVLALINLRCKMSSNNSSSEGQENGSNPKGPLWERISQGMTEMGYKRNAKRCKEKWENINKYFRKTKDSSKKRSMNSRTCPYFHQLSCLYSDGTIVAPNQMTENQ